MHDQTIGFQQFLLDPSLDQKAECIPLLRKVFLALTFMLDPKQVHHVGSRQNLVNIMRNSYAKLLKFARDQCAWPNECDASAEFEEAENIRTRNPAEEYVAIITTWRPAPPRPLFSLMV
jgi:hypothetical protein